MTRRPPGATHRRARSAASGLESSGGTRPNEELSIRPATSGDLSPMVAAFEEADWARPREQLERYLAEQTAGLRVFVAAHAGDDVAGYGTLVWDSDYLPFRGAGIPEIQDLNVLPRFRRSGIASALLDTLETLAFARSERVGLGVGLYAAYGPAQRLYGLRGYAPDGRGVTQGNRSLVGGETVLVDDQLVLHLVRAPPS